MSYRLDQTDENAIVMEGMENGISEDPYQGIADMRNVNIISIPGEGSVNFATAKISASSFTLNITSVDTVNDYIIFDSLPTLETGQAIFFSAVSFASSVTTGTLAAGPYYYIKKISDTSAELYTSLLNLFLSFSKIDIVGAGTGTASTVDMNVPKHFAFDPNEQDTYLVDGIGHVWANTYTTTSGYFTFTGNKVPQYSNGNGLVFYQSFNSATSATQGYIFVFHGASIDYALTSISSPAGWNYQWTPGVNYVAPGTYSANPTATLKSITSRNYSHEAFVAPDNKVYFCDANYIDRFYQASLATPFLPTTANTYVWDQTAVLPFTDVAQCMSPLGNNLLIGGRYNVVYPWDTFSQLPQYPILLAEGNVQKMVTVNTNTYIFTGNRGRIYVTNGSQAQLFKKISDFISGTVEPYYTWGGVCSQKNQLYFGFSVTTNAGVANNNYGGVWGIDVDTQALRLTNKLSYGTYAGYASAIMPNFTNNPAGTGLYIGWYDGVSAYGVDTTVSTPYTGSQALIDFDLIPIGTFYRPKTFKTVEYKLSMPLVAGESVSILYRTKISDAFTPIFTSSTAGTFSDNKPVNFANAQWLQIRAILNSTASNPSYTRLKEVRIK